MPKVNCTVDSCQYWGEDQKCLAEEIWVKNDISGDPDQFANHFINASSEEYGSDLGTADKSSSTSKKSSSGIAQTSPQTCCDTMKPKGRSQK